MAIQKTIHVGSKDIPMRASALIPRLYRVKFGRDMIRDMKALQDSYNEAKDDAEKDLTVADLTIFENIAWLLAKHADPNVPSDPDEWLDSIDGILSIYEVLPEILSMWSENLHQTSVQAKK